MKPSNSSDAAQLPRTGFLAYASDDLHQLFSTLAKPVALDQGAVLFHEGDKGEALFAVIMGAVEISVLSSDGRKLSLDVMKSGAVLGEIALFDQGPRTATITALEASQLLKVNAHDVLASVREHPNLALDLVRLAGQRMRWMNQQLSEQVFLPLPARLARKILYLMNGVPEGQSLAFSQGELADFVGSTREAVSKTLSTWRKAGIVSVARGRLRVVETEALELMAGIDAKKSA
jgi:CRP-like cAMP-binding protein